MEASRSICSQMNDDAPRTSPRADALVLLSVALLIYVADQVSKALVAANIGLDQRIRVVGDLVQLWHARNAGAAFSLFQGGQLLFLVVSVVALGMIVYFHRAFRGHSGWLQVVLGLILGGTLGNLTDRLRQGYVTDFVSIGVGDMRWPTFNVADSSIMIGIGLLVVYLVFVDRMREGATT